MTNKILKSMKKETKTLVNFKASKAQLKDIEKNAKAYANGNVSEWIRFSAINYKPKKSDLA